MSADGTFGKRHVGEGDLIYMEGDPGTETFLIQSGRVELVRRASDGLFETIATLGPGQVFGELALASDAPRKEGARALADCLLIAVKRDRIEASLYSADPFVAALYRILAGQGRRQRLGHRGPHQGRELGPYPPVKSIGALD